MVEVDASLTLTGPHGPLTLLDAFEGRRQLIAYYFMWHAGHPAAEQCEGCTWVTTQVTELSYLHSRDITYAVFCQGPYDESVRYRDFMGWDMPWYSAEPHSARSWPGARSTGCTSCATCETATACSRPTGRPCRGVEAMDYSYALMDLTVYGRQEAWEDSPPGWPQRCSNTRTDAGAPDWPPVAVVAGRAPHRPVAAAGGRTLRRPHRPTLIVRAPASAGRPARCARRPETGAWPIRFPSATRRSSDRIRSHWPDVPAAR